MTKYKKMYAGLEKTFFIGEDTYFTSVAPVTEFVVSFEDDLTTGYFYAVSVNNDINILDALHIYNVSDVTHRDEPCKIQILWTEDGTIASLLINNYCHAVFNFEKHEGYCRNAFPGNLGGWSQNSSRALTDELIEKIFAVENTTEMEQ